MQDKAKLKLKMTEIMQKCKDKVVQKARKENVSINEATFSTGHESMYSVEQAKEL